MGLNSLNFSSCKGQEQRNKLALASVGAFTAGKYLPTFIQLPINGLFLESMSKISRTLPKDTVEIVNKNAQKVLDEVTDLSSKGVKIIDCKNIGLPTPKANTLCEKISNYISSLLNPLIGTQTGKNACFSFDTNEIIYRKEKMSLAAFHEIGHAHNKFHSKFWRAIQKSRRPLSIIPLAITAFVAFTKNSKPENGQELTVIQKTKNFIRNHAEIFAFASTIPALAEEITASVKGCKWANKLLDKNLAKKVLKSNILGGITYLSIGGITALSVHIAKKIKDNAVAKQEASTNT